MSRSTNPSHGAINYVTYCKIFHRVVFESRRGPHVRTIVTFVRLPASGPPGHHPPPVTIPWSSPGKAAAIFLRRLVAGIMEE